MNRIIESKFANLIVGVIAGLVVASSFSLGLFKGLENLFEDTLFSPKSMSPEIVLVAIDNESIAKIGQWPWPREIFAKVLESLSTKPPKTVGIDIVFSEDSRLGESDDQKLEDELEKTAFPVVLASEAVNAYPYDGILRTSDFLLPLDRFTQSSKVYLSHVNLSLDPDGIVRNFPLKIELENKLGNETFNNFAYQLSLLSSGKKDYPAIGEINRIAYSSFPGGIRKIPLWRILEDKNTAESLNDKIVLIGATAPDLHDEQMTPISRGTPMPGVEIQANILNMFLESYRLSDIPAVSVIVIIFCIALISSVIFVFVDGILKPAAANIFLLIIYVIAIIIFFDSGRIINIVHVVGISVLSIILQIILRYLLVERNKKELKEIFSKYVSRSVLDEILLNPKNIKLGGEEKTASILFSDIRGFTTLSEKMTPSELTQYLNKYLTCMTDIILAERGLIDKYIGDAIMAFWGAPLSDKNHALNSIKSAVRMIGALKAFNENNIKSDGLEIDIGIGINSGLVVAGNMGSERRLSYTLMGDAVNLASRLESLNKMYRTNIIASEAAINTAGADNLKSNNIGFRMIDCVKVKGKNHEVNIFEIFDDKKSPVSDEISKNYSIAFKYYQSGNWSESLIYFEKVLKSIPKDGPSAVLKKRCEEFIKNPPKNWSGAYELESK